MERCIAFQDEHHGFHCGFVIKRISLIAFHSAATGSLVRTHPMHLFSILMGTVEMMRPSMLLNRKSKKKKYM